MRFTKHLSMVSRDGLEPSTHSLKETYTTTKFPVNKKKPLFNVLMGVIKHKSYVKFEI